MVNKLFGTKGVRLSQEKTEKTVTYRACWTKKRRVCIGYEYGFGWVSKKRVGNAWFYRHKSLASDSDGDGDGW